MTQIFQTTVTSKRHREIGYCEKSDFGTLDLWQLNKDEKKLIVSFKDYKKEVEYIEFKGTVYIKIHNDYRFQYMSREDDTLWTGKQGKFSVKSALKLVLDLRQKFEGSFSNVSSGSYILIGNTLYAEYCKRKDLAITVCGNLLFSCWLSIGIEAHAGKANIKLSKKSLDDTIRKEKARFDKAKGSQIGKVDNHVSFSYPKNVKWGN